MHSVMLMLCSQLLRDALGAVLARARVPVVDELQDRVEPDDRGDTALCIIADTVSYKTRSDAISAHRAQGCKIVVLVEEADLPTFNEEQVAELDGIITHNISAESFVRCLQLIEDGERLAPRELMASLLARGASSAQLDAKASDHARNLTPREKEVLAHLVQGQSNKVIAWQLGMAQATVKVHLKSLLRKIDAENRTQAAIWALSNGDALKKD